MSWGGSVRWAGLGTIILLTVIISDLGTVEGVVEGAEGSCDDDAEEVADVVVDALSELDLLDELDKLAGEGVDVVEDD